MLCKTAVLSVKMADHCGNQRYHVEKSVPIAFILSSTWEDGAESLRIERPNVMIQCEAAFNQRPI